VAAHQAADRFISALDQAVSLQCLLGVFRAGRPIPAALREQGSAVFLIYRDNGCEYADS